MSADDVKQAQIDAQTAEVVERNGGRNFLNANYIHLFAEKAIGANDAILARLQPDVQIDMEDPAWKQATCVALAFIKRYHLDETKETMKLEFPEEKGLPSKTGFSKSKELDAFFEKIGSAIQVMKERSFEKNVDIFAKEAGLASEKPKREERRKTEDDSESRSSHSSHKHRHHH